MAIPPAFLDEIRARVALSSVVGRTVKLQRAGREWKACCPFHHEKTPSFTLSDDKGFYHCFGCGAHGDVIRFLIEHEGLPFREAVERLAAEAGLALPEEARDEREARARASGLHDIMGEAASWFRDQLNGISGADARTYLDQRGLAPAVRDAFALGYAPDARGKLKTALKGHGIDKLVEGGLLIAPEGDREPYDRFRGRLIFPIRDPRGRVIAFGGRILGSGEPKYLNSPDTPLFDKGRILYNLDRAGPAARKSGRLVVAEGYMDVIALDGAGIPAVAPLGTALTEAQLELLWRQVDVPLLCFDGDAAGQRAAARAALRALPLLKPGKSLGFVTLPKGQDPDDLIRDGGAAAIIALLDTPQPLAERLWQEELAARPVDTPEARAGLRQRIRAHISAITDRDVRDAYAADMGARFDDAFRRREPARQRDRTPGGRWSREPAQPRAPLSEIRALGNGSADPVARALFIALIEHPRLAVSHAATLAELPLDDPILEQLRAILVDLAYAGGKLDKSALDHTLASAGAGVLAEEIRRRNRRSAKLNFSFTRPVVLDDRAERDFAAVLEDLVARAALTRSFSTIDAAVGRAMETDDSDGQQRLLDERRAVQTELERLDAHLRALARSDED